MSGRESRAAGQEFRPHRVLTGLMGGAGLLWCGVLVYLLRFDGVPLRTVLSALFFVLLFGASLAWYARTRITVDARGLTYRGVMRTRQLAFADILKVDVLPGLLTVYSVCSRQGRVQFTSLFAQHRRLARLLVERARLTPQYP